MPTEESVPDFIIGGAMKAGTTFLHRALAQHPHVFIPDGEVHFFCVDDAIQHPDFWRARDFDRDYERSVEWYRSLFDSASAGQLIGEDSTTYLPSQKAPERIRNVRPNVKLIFLLRDPVARTYSHYWHRVKTGRAVHRFEQELELGTSNLYLRSFYKSQLERYFELFVEDQIKVIISERLFERPQEVLNSVCAFLGIDSMEFENPDRNSSSAPRSLFAQLLLNYAESRMRRRYDKPLPEATDEREDSFYGRSFQSILFRLRHWNLDSRSYPPMKEETRKRLSRIFARENEGISELIGTDVTPYWPSMRDRKR